MRQSSIQYYPERSEGSISYCVLRTAYCENKNRSSQFAVRSTILDFAIWMTLILFCFLIFTPTIFADVYPFEEDYSAAPAAVTKAPAKVMVSEEPSFQVRQEEVTQSERLQAQHQIDEENRTDRFLSYRQITFQNAGQIFLNFWNGLAVEYKDIFTRALPEYGSDLVSIPGGTVEVVGKFAEIERKELFERGAKEKDIQAYVEAQEKPLTPEEQKALDELRGKPISTGK